MKKLLVKCCVIIALSASVAFSGAGMVQAAYVDVTCGYEIGIMPFGGLPDEKYDCKNAPAI